MFRRIAIVLLLSLPAWAQAPRNAAIIFYRQPHVIGRGVDAGIVVDGTRIGALENGRYFALTIAPGTHTVAVPKGDGDGLRAAGPITLHLAAGEEVFVRVSVEACFILCNASLTRATEDQRNDEFPKLKPNDAKLINDSPQVSLEPYTPGAAAARSEAFGAPPPAQVVQPPAAPPAPTTGSLVITTQPTSAQIYLDDAFKGTSSADGKLVVPDVKVGPHVVRLTAPGYKETVAPVTVAAGDNPLLLTAERAGPKPLTEREVERALTDGIPKPRVEALIKEYGVDFALTTEIQQRLRDAGADDSVLLAVATNKK